MTLKPTITSSKGANTVLSSSEWNTDVIQSDNYLQELLAGTNPDKIPGSAIAPNVALAGAVVSGGLTVSSGGQTISSGGLNVNAGTTSVQALTATTGAFTGAVQSNSHPVVEGTAAAAHVECIAGQSASVGAGAETTVTLTFARAYASEPAYSIGVGTTGAGNAYNIANRLVSISTTAITVAWKNTDAGAQTLSHLSISCVGV